GEPEDRAAVLRLPALLPLVYRLRLPQRTARAQLQGLLHPGPADVLFGTGAQRHAGGRRFPRRNPQDGVLRHARLSPRGEARRGLNPETTLVGLHGRLLREFSRRTTARLRAVLP